MKTLSFLTGPQKTLWYTAKWKLQMYKVYLIQQIVYKTEN